MGLNDTENMEARRGPATPRDCVQFRVGFSPPEGAYATLPQKQLCTEPAFRAPLEELEKFGFNIWNEAKLCGTCGKTCAGMLSVCNGCGSALAAELTRTPNALLGFTYGVESIGDKSAKFSLRYQDPSVFVFDDMVSRTPIHLCCVPSTVIRDVKELLARDDAYEIICMLEEAGRKAIEDMVTPEWLTMMGITLERLLDLLICGFNAAPSQFQLHLHVKAPPLLPEDYYLTMAGVRFTHRRWLPLEYVKACAAVSPRPVLSPDDDVVDFFDRLGHFSYATMMKDAVQRYCDVSDEMNLWREEWFTHSVVDGKVLDQDGNEDAASVADWVKRDKLAMQNCGRPFINGQPTPINFYKFAPRISVGGM